MVGLIAGRWPFTAMDISGPVPVPPKPFPFPPEYFREPLPTPAELAMDAAAKGNKASADSDYALAIEYYTKALTEMPRAPGYFISRSTAYSRLKTDDGKSHFEAAFNDAEIATRLAFDRGNRELLISAQMRRAVSLYQLGRLGDAAFLFEILETKLGTTKPKADKQEGVQAAMSGSDAGSKTNYTTQLPIWLAKVRRQAMEKADGDDKWTVTIEEIPDNIAIPTVPELKAQLSAVKAGNMQELARAKAAGTLPKAKKREPMVVEKAANFRHDWYQTNDYVYVTLYVNNLNHDVFSIKFLNDSVVVRLPLPDGTEYEYVLGPFWGKVLTSECTYQFRPSKIEMKLPKQESRKWHALEAAKADVGADVTPTAAPKTAPSAPTYPTSSRNGPKDWDKVASSLSGNSAKKSEGGKQKDDDSDDELGGDSVDGFFKQLYAGADPETRRAMIKSYTESQGTSLSTNWSEVGKGTVKPVESDKN